jgi:lipopolysaccharide export LptBFGC system permease protein LptF
MSAASLIVERSKFQEQYHRERAHRLERLQALGVTADDFRRFAPDQPAWLTAMMNTLRWLGRRRDPFEQLGERTAAIRNEIEMWAIERDALMRRMATLSVEIHKKFSLPAACIVFVLVGAPIGMRVRRAGPAVAFVSVLFFLFYYMCLVGGEELANRLLLPPWLAMWLANLVIGWFGIRWTLEACELRAPQRRALPGTRTA